METLHEIWDNLNEKGMGSDKGDIHSYLPVYEEILAPYRETAKNVLEIGLFRGDSLRMWESYFINANVHGIDCDEQPHGGMADLRPMIAEGTHNIIIGDATSETDVEKHFKDTMFDFVCDDGNHVTDCQIKTFNLLKNKMNSGALYIIEDAGDIDKDSGVYLSLHNNVEILDMRKIKSRFDDVLILIRF